MSRFIHGNDATNNMSIFRGGRQLIVQNVYKRAGSQESVAFLTYKDAAEKPRSSYHFDQWCEDEVILILEPSQGPYLPAQVGDEIRHVDGGLSIGYRWRHVVTEDDLDRGYVVGGEYQGVRSGRLEHPVFLRPRTFYQRGNAERASQSVF
ncbi:MAG: hypothetical protein WAZ14_01705 [Patescibacteria group bacterium]